MDATLRSRRHDSYRPAPVKTVCAKNGHDCKAYDAAVTLRLIRASKGLVS